MNTHSEQLHTHTQVLFLWRLPVECNTSHVYNLLLPHSHMNKDQKIRLGLTPAKYTPHSHNESSNDVITDENTRVSP